MALTPKAIDKVRAVPAVADVVRGEQVRINFTVPAAVRRRWKIEALERGKTLTDMIIDAVNTQLSKG